MVTERNRTDSLETHHHPHITFPLNEEEVSMMPCNAPPLPLPTHNFMHLFL